MEAIKSNEILHFDFKFLNDFYNKSCIYFLGNEINGKKSEIVYIGKTQNLGKRLSDHFHDVTKKFTSFSYLFVDNEIMNEVEELLINIFRPRFNKISGNWLAKKMSEALGTDYSLIKNQYKLNNHYLNIDTALDILMSHGIQSWLVKSNKEYDT